MPEEVPPVVSIDAHNPYAPPKASEAKLPPLTRQSYEGIGRLAFVFVTVIIVVGGQFLLASLEAPAALLTMLVMMLPVSSRLKNIGRHPAWCFLLPIPLLNLFVTIPCLLCPPGYQHHRKLDLPAKIIIGLLVALLLLALGSIFLE